MKITIPQSIQDITLEQYQRYDVLIKREDLDSFQFNKRKMKIFTDIGNVDMNLINKKDFDIVSKMIDEALNMSVEFKPTFHINNVEYGFIPNFDKLTAGEYRDISIYGTEVETLHKLMTILFRPIKNKDAFGNYKILPYKGTEGTSEIIKQMPLSIVNGALLFFLSLLNELESYTLKSMEVELAKVI
jgi:nucleoside-specific outer membrane channel protein Tsx